MPYVCRICESDDDYAAAGLFILRNKDDLHPGYTTVDALTLLYSYVTEGNMIQVTDESGTVLGLVCYYFGTPELEFADRSEVVLLDQAIAVRSSRSTYLFVRGFQFLVQQVLEQHPGVREVRFTALAERGYLRRLYGKFAEEVGSRESPLGQEVLYRVDICRLQAFLNRYQ